MKKLITALVAVMIIAFSAVPAFALSVNSPIATTQEETQPTTSSTIKKDTNPDSPKTGSDSVVVYSVIALSAAACGAATLFAVKKAKANK